MLGDKEPSAEQHQALLGYPCPPEIRSEVLQILSSMNPGKRTLIYDWAMYPLDELAFLAHDHVRNYHGQDPERENPLAQEATQGYLDNLISWLELIRTSEKVPFLEHQEPEDGVGEQIDHYVWTLEEGGSKNPLLAEQAEFIHRQFEQYKRYTAGNIRMIERPESIAQRIPYETQQEKLQRQLEKERKAARELFRMLKPEFEALDRTLERLGIDPITLQKK